MASAIGRFKACSARRASQAVRLGRVCATDAASYEDCARQLYEQAWSKGAVEVLDEVMAEGHQQRDMIWGGASGDSRASMQKAIPGFRRAYPDLKFTIENISSDPQQNICFVEWTAQGTYSGGWEGAEVTGDVEHFGGVSALTIRDNQIVETRVYREALQVDKAKFMGGASG